MITLQDIQVILTVMSRAPIKGDEAKAVALAQHRLESYGQQMIDDATKEPNGDDQDATE